MEEAYLKAKELVTNKYGRNYKYFALLTLALTAVIYKYKDYDGIVTDLFNQIEFYIENDTVTNIMKKNHISEYDEDTYYSNAISFCGCSVDYDENDDEINVIVERPKILLDSSINKTLVLNELIHEFNHLIKGVINGYDSCDEECSVSFRSGLQIFKYIFNKEEKIETTLIYFCIFDEAINVLETTEMTESLLMLDGIIPDDDVKIHYDMLDKELMHDDIGYELVTKEIRPLWENETFKRLIEDNIMIGNLAEIIYSFDSVLGEEAFENFAILLDDYDEEIMNNGISKKSKKIQSKIRSVVNMYNNLTNFVYKK